MPYKSEAQRRFFNSPAGKKKIGEEEVEKWNEESKGLKLPKKSLKDAIIACDKDNPVEGQIDIFGKTYESKKLKPIIHKFKIEYDVKAAFGKERKYINSNTVIIEADSRTDAINKLKKEVKKERTNYYPEIKHIYAIS